VPSEIHNVFISHIHEDDDGLKKLKALLENHGHLIRDGSITSDRPNNATSEDYIKSQILAPRIRWAGVLIVYVSPDTRNSSYVNWEIEYAHKIGKRVIGVWAPGAKDTDLPRALDEYAYAVVGWNSERIIDAINGDIDDWSGPEGNPRPERAISRYACN
jgi:hypothetical protein